MSSALWWVSKGRAAAPPGMACIMGVSTSRKSRSVKKSRVALMMRERVFIVAMPSGLA